MILTTCAGRDGDDHGDGVDGIVAGDTENDGDGEDGGDGTSDGDEKLANAMMMVLMTCNTIEFSSVVVRWTESITTIICMIVTVHKCVF